MPTESESQEPQKQNLMYGVAYCVNTGLLNISIVYCLEEDHFYIYQQGVWRKIFEIEILSMISNTKEFKWVNNHAIGTRKQIIENLKVIVYKKLADFNTHPYLNFPDGEFDPVARELYPHEKAYYSTIRIPYPYDHSSKCPLWLKTINEILEDDPKKVKILQEFFGYCLTRDTRQRKALLLLGESNCGKSTILQILRSMIGDKNCSSVPLKYIPNPQYTPMLINKLINIDTDVSAKAAEYEAEFKIITSGEPLHCNQKFIAAFDFVPYCKIVMAANIFPKITDHSSAFYNRLILIPCNRIFTEQEQNKNLFKELEAELPGIFNWAVKGLQRLNERGYFEKDDFMAEAVQELENENNPSNLFFDEHIEIEFDSYIEKKDLFEKYKSWCILTKNFTLSKERFASCVYKRFHKETPKDARYSEGLRPRIWKNIRYVHFKQAPIKEEAKISWMD